jgi:hypothetical protein
MKKVVEEGVTLVKERNNLFALTAIGKTDLVSVPGVQCVNPRAAEAKRIYKKIFMRTPIYMPDEYDRAVREVLSGGKDILIMGMNGYSEVGPERCAKWGVKPGAYDAACENLLDTVVRNMQEKFPGVDIRFADGASDLGVDRAIARVAKRLNLPRLGHSCPRFLFYVQDNGVPVYVAKDQKAYSDAFIESLHVLIAVNGREQSFRHDIDAAFLKGRHVIPVNVLRAISEIGGPPAFGPDGKVEDAVAAFEQRVHLITLQMGMPGHDQWQNVLNSSKEVLASICRMRLSPERAFSIR